MNALGLQMSDLIKPKLTLKAANTTGMEILGGVFVEVIIIIIMFIRTYKRLCSKLENKVK